MTAPSLASLPDTIHPPVRTSEHGSLRKVGVEIELTELDVPSIAEAVAQVVGGRIRRETDYIAHIDSDGHGEFHVEADMALLRSIGRRREAGADGDTGLLSAARDAVASVAETIAPFEVVGPPLPYDQLPLLDDVVAALRARGGRGTKAGVLSALGLQLNPEIPERNAVSLHAHLSAYALLDPWLRLRRGVDLSRRATWYIDPYPHGYVRALLSRAHAPPLDELIDEYLRFNPTRNRSLDMLPLLSELDPDRVRAAVDDPRIKSRPTFHYRLPDSRVGDPSWRVTDEWRHWLVVERVAARPALLAELAAVFLGVLDEPGLSSPESRWAPRCEQMLAAARFGAD